MHTPLPKRLFSLASKAPRGAIRVSPLLVEVATLDGPGVCARLESRPDGLT